MTTVRDVCHIVDQLAPPGLAYSWDKVGLSIGSLDARVTHVVTALSITDDVHRAAKRLRAQLIISHHPLIWEPLRSLRSDDPQARLCLDLAKANIACYSAHTNLDVVPGGVNDALAQRLGLRDLRPLLSVEHATQVKLVTFVPDSHLAQLRNVLCDAGAGIIGDYTHCSFSTPGIGTFLPGKSAKPFTGKKHKVNEEPERRFEVLVQKARIDAVVHALKSAHPYEEIAYDIVVLENRDASISLGKRGTLSKTLALEAFAHYVCKALEIPDLRVIGPKRKSIRRVGVLGGAGGSLLESMPRDLDAVVTGDVKYHEALTAHQLGLTVIDAGHWGTEKWIVPALAKSLRAKLRGVRVSAIPELNPFRTVTE